MYLCCQANNFAFHHHVWQDLKHDLWVMRTTILPHPANQKLSPSTGMLNWNTSPPLVLKGRLLKPWVFRTYEPARKPVLHDQFARAATVLWAAFLGYWKNTLLICTLMWGYTNVSTCNFWKQDLPANCSVSSELTSAWITTVRGEIIQGEKAQFSVAA